MMSTITERPIRERATSRGRSDKPPNGPRTGVGEAEGEFHDSGGGKYFLTRREREIWLDWLRPLLRELLDGTVSADLAFGVVTGAISFVELSRRWQMDRRTARVRWRALLTRIRRAWLTRLSAAILNELRAGRFIGIEPFTMRTVELLQAVSKIAPGEHRFDGVPTVSQLTEYVSEVYPTLFGRRGAVLSLRIVDEESTTASIVVPLGYRSFPRSRDEDRFALAA